MGTGVLQWSMQSLDFIEKSILQFTFHSSTLEPCNFIRCFLFELTFSTAGIIWGGFFFPLFLGLSKSLQGLLLIPVNMEMNALAYMSIYT